MAITLRLLIQKDRKTFPKVGPSGRCDHCGHKHSGKHEVCLECGRIMADPPEFCQYVRLEENGKNPSREVAFFIREEKAERLENRTKWGPTFKVAEIRNSPKSLEYPEQVPKFPRSNAKTLGTSETPGSSQLGSEMGYVSELTKRRCLVCEARLHKTNKTKLCIVCEYHLGPLRELVESGIM